MESKRKLKKILVTGAAGQIGTELLVALRRRYGNSNVVGVGRRTPLSAKAQSTAPGPFMLGVDVCNAEHLEKVWATHPQIDAVVHLAAVLSAAGEARPRECWRVNCDGTLNVLDFALKHAVSRVLLTSSLAAFGTAAGKVAAQSAALNPASMYGVTKVAMEKAADYYRMRYGLDVVGLRLPGIMSSEALPGAGTDVYTTHMLYAAAKGEDYECYLRPDTELPMAFMPDAVEGIIRLLEADSSQFSAHTAFNVRGFVLSPKALAQSIRRHYPAFQVKYANDHLRQSIADSWPNDLDDSCAQKEWRWRPRFGVHQMVDAMFAAIRKRKQQTGSFYPIKAKL